MNTENKKADPECIHCSGTGQYVDFVNDTTVDCVCVRNLGNPITDDPADSLEFKQHPEVAGIAMRITTSEGKVIYNRQNREREAILAARDHCQLARDTLLEHCPDDGEIMMVDTCLSQALYWFDKAREKW